MANGAPRGSIPTGCIRTVGTARVSVVTRLDTRHGLVVHLVRGRITLGHLVTALEESLDLGLVEIVLFNMLEGDLTGLTLEELSAFAEHLVTAPGAPRRCAIVCRRGTSLGAASLAASLAADFGAACSVAAFETSDDALDWLGVSERPTTPAPSGPVRAR